MDNKFLPYIRKFEIIIFIKLINNILCEQQKV